jgi:hypothetical protein
LSKPCYQVLGLMWNLDALQLGQQDNILISYLPLLLIILFSLLYGQRLQLQIWIVQLGNSINRLKVIRDVARRDVIEFLKPMMPQGADPTEKVDRMLEYFTIFPVDLDPYGLVRKLEHVALTQDERLRKETAELIGRDDNVTVSQAVNVVSAAMLLNLIYKVVRHYYILGKKTSAYVYIVTLQALMPQILQEAEALYNAMDAFKQMQPIGDGIGPMVAGRLMLGLERKRVEKDTVMCEMEFKGRKLYVLKAEGPGGNTGYIGNAVTKLVKEMKIKFSTIIMVDAALKLEGENTGDLAEGVGAAIGGLGVDRYKIEEVATAHGIPTYAIVIKQSIMDAITVMKREIAEAAEKAINAVQRIILEKSKEGDNVLLIGVGNTIGII